MDTLDAQTAAPNERSALNGQKRGANTAGATSAKDAVNAQVAPRNEQSAPNEKQLTGGKVAATSAQDALREQTAPRNEQSALNEQEQVADKAKNRGEEPERRPRKCGCACEVQCNCRCACAHRDHCACKSPCDGKCGTEERASRNLVVSIDGTSNQFGWYNTNVVALHNRVLRDAKQNKYYNCGIGTYVPYQNKTSWKYWRQKIDNNLDLAFALNFKDIILQAYHWLSQTYQKRDKIFFFGFSRGAYQVRTLAGMIEAVGLVDTGNEALIQFAYEIYLERHKGVRKNATDVAVKFKETFSRDVRIHFVGVWDTVSSVGIFRGKPLPLTSSAAHICIFRHALALDERRVKFLPEYVDGGSSTASTAGEKGRAIDVKEVWFAGSHSDIGGGVKENLNLDLSSVPLLWMENEAAAAGLRLLPEKEGGRWKLEDLRTANVHNSLKGFWKFLEYLPLIRLSFQTPKELTSTPHLGAGRIIAPGQRIHISL
ncbi:hypothetical protein DFH08DRAFT_709712, partial [Mycena albidolilacea]